MLVNFIYQIDTVKSKFIQTPSTFGNKMVIKYDKNSVKLCQNKFSLIMSDNFFFQHTNFQTYTHVQDCDQIGRTLEPCTYMYIYEELFSKTR